MQVRGVPQLGSSIGGGGGGEREREEVKSAQMSVCQVTSLFLL